MKIEVTQISFSRQVVEHFYLGVLITLFYVWVSPKVINAGYPGLSVLLIAELLILAPVVFLHLYRSAERRHNSWAGVIPYRKRMPVRSFISWTAGGMVACIIVYIPLYPLGLALRESLFYWLPEWYFNPSFGTEDIHLIANTFLLAILIDGMVGPVAEELFFRGYLLPRMANLGKWAPVINGAFFGLYHFWQPHNAVATMAIGMILSFVVWKTKSVYPAIVIHCVLNVLGALTGYLAVSGGVVIGR